jgi:hypothetical protein
MNEQQTTVKEWLAFYRMEGPTMEHLFVDAANVSACGHMKRDGNRTWGKPMPKCAQCQRRAQHVR